MSQELKTQVLNMLDRVIYPGTERSIVDLKMVSEVFITDGKAYFSISVPSDVAEKMEPLRLEAQKAAQFVDGIHTAVVALPADHKPSAPAPRPARPAHPVPPKPQAPQRDKIGVPGVKAIIAVASGKGGVGKST